MGKPTPGPWSVFAGWSEYLGIQSEDFAGSIATVPKSHERAEADARLIAAAPELYEALRALLRVSFHLSHCPAYPPGCMDETCTCGFDEAEEAARAALAKATRGES